MDFTKLCPVGNPTQIITAIESGLDFGGDIWQTDISGRNICPIIESHIDINQGKLIFRTHALSRVLSFYPIYIRMKYRHLLFRLEPEEFQVVEDKVICNFPKDALALLPRKTERYVMPFSQDISLSLKRSARTIREISFDLEVRIIDVSEQGFGILISGMNKDYLRAYDHFWIKAIDHRSLSHEIFGTVLYVAPKGYYLKRHDVRLGLSLSTPLSYEMFEYLKNKSQLILTA